MYALRYLGIQLTRDNNITTGKIYQSVIVRHYPETLLLFFAAHKTRTANERETS